jgi:hypothetical protein
MALEKVVTADLIEVIANGIIQVRTRTSIMEDGTEISSTFHRHVVAPGDDYSAQDARVKAICAATHTDSVIALYKASLERN